MEMKKHEILEKMMCKELDMLAEKYEKANGEMAVQDLEKIDKLYHALKSQATYTAMKEAEGYGYDEDGMSGRRMRNPDTGRYVSGRDRMYYDGYSGHYPMPYPPYNGGWPR